MQRTNQLNTVVTSLVEVIKQQKSRVTFSLSRDFSANGKIERHSFAHLRAIPAPALYLPTARRAR